MCALFSKREIVLMLQTTDQYHWLLYAPKLWNTFIYHSIMEHLNSHNILINSQHGFRSNHSCVSQLIALVEDLSYALDQQKQIDVILLDFAKVFDSVPHQRLLVKLRNWQYYLSVDSFLAYPKISTDSSVLLCIWFFGMENAVGTQQF